MVAIYVMVLSCVHGVCTYPVDVHMSDVPIDTAQYMYLRVHVHIKCGVYMCELCNLMPMCTLHPLHVPSEGGNTVSRSLW